MVIGELGWQATVDIAHCQFPNILCSTLHTSPSSWFHTLHNNACMHITKMVL